MPGFHVALSYLNQIFGNPALLLDNQAELLAFYAPSDNPNAALDQLQQTVQHLLSGEGSGGAPPADVDPTTIAGFMRGLPPTHAEAGRAIIYRNLQRPKPFGMTFAWAPAYDHELTVSESPPIDGTSPGWITVVLKGRYPFDPHPVTGQGLDEPWEA
jgi:hypothetical protein